MSYPPKLERGAIIGDRYRVERVLGSGGMGRVYLTSDAKLPGKWWAVKETIAHTADYERIENEAKMLIKLRHASLPQVADFFAPDAEGRVFLVMEYIEGENLGEVMRRSGGNLDIPFVLELFISICETLEYLHAQKPPIVFRDLKPGNIMIGKDNQIRLIDFGIARDMNPDKNADTVKLGTIGFAAPEQYEGQSDPSSDQYALGGLLLYLSTGGRFSEWTSEAERHLRSDLPAGCIPVMRKMLSHRRQDRYASITDAKEQIQPRHRTDHRNDEQFTSSSIVGTTTIAILGNFAGCGATHTAIAVAHTLSREGGKTAIVELGRRAHTFEKIALEWEGESLNGRRSFTVQGVDYWCATEKERLHDLFGKGYRYIVLDLGVCKESRDFEEFLRADLPIIVGSGSEWRSKELVSFVHRETLRSSPKWTYLLPFATEEAVKEMRRTLRSKNVYAVPPLDSPFDGNLREELEPLLHSLYVRKERRSFLKFGFR
ncbi:serine/threonine-protein kinase [Saccharibacillus sp. JS10]|uniref:serine/threonine protein kinase n=1 Tax=Saccharibacillus sp. JS10 TaxID=2950552 RepID=UPI00210BCAF3|nr:serine/threonine-protein kinase [Saccharibacillus sp. JS10]MCQ4085603.1 serine/threonine protein kinase [Saccharibacillus sp. JS10]